jgi:SPP1 family predicted phage head-tail adaptor
MKSGRLRHRVHLQSKTVTRDAFGGETIAWASKTPSPIWAEISPLSAREYFAAQQERSQVTHKIIIRYFSGLQTAWRVLWGSRQFDIVSVINPEERNKEMILLCTEWIR